MKHSKLSSYLYKKKSDHGFTLIELMVVVAIVGILASVAYPSYMNQVRKSRRSDAVTVMSRFQQAQERWRANKTTYASQASAIATITPAVTTPPTEAGLGLSPTSDGGYYTIEVSSNTSIGYILTATAVPGKSQATDTGCVTLIIKVTGGNARNWGPNGTELSPDPNNCWSK